MKYALIILLAALLSGAAAFLVMKGCGAPVETAAAGSATVSLAEPVERQVAAMVDDIRSRLAAFAGEVAGDQLFSLRLIVENYPSAPEVVNKAVQFLKPMGFSLLDITDSAYTVISCGHFPASAGNSAARKMEKLTDAPSIIADRMMGREVITLQARHTFRIAESLVFHVAGGVEVNEGLLERLAPFRGVRVLFKQGNVVLGMGTVKTISEVRDGSVIINDRTYEAAALPLTVADGEEPATLIVIREPGGV